MDKLSTKHRVGIFGVVLAMLATLFVISAPSAGAAALQCGAYRSAFVFIRPGGANGLGHVGWGYRVTCTGTFYFGSVENPSGQAHVDPGFDNGFWWQSGTEGQMLGAMRSRGYTSYKTTLLALSTLDPDRASAVAGASGSTGYDVLGNNCADNTWDVLANYGLPNLPLLQFHPSPNDWYINLVDTPNIDWTTSTRL